MHEIELKFGLPVAQLDAVRAELARLGADIARPQILQAAYFDTPDRRLAQARAALRVRREDDEWVQTFKSAGLNTMVRVEDNQPATPPASSAQGSADGEALRPDLSRHQQAARQVLMQALGWQPERDPPGHHSGLMALYRTDMRRTRARLTVAEGTPHEGMVELALDEGAILAGEGPQQRCEAVCELEIELLSGAPQAVILAANAWVDRFGLWLDTQTKAHRGDRLARQVLPMPEHADKPTEATNRPTTTDASCDSGSTPPTPWPIALESALGRYTRVMSALASPSGPIAPDTVLSWRDASHAIAAVAHTESAQPWAHDLAAQAETLAQRMAASEPNQPEMLTALARSADATRLALAVFTVLLAA
ncbi:MAG: CYTH domain-containing protein [Aquabacterium sp.]